MVYYSDFNLDKYWISKYKVSTNRKVITRRTYIWYKFGIYLSGGIKNYNNNNNNNSNNLSLEAFDSESMALIIEHYLFRILKLKHSMIFKRIEKLFIGPYINPSELIESQKVTSLDIKRYIAALYSCYVSRNASRKIIRCFKYKETYFDPKLIIIDDSNEVVGVKYKEEKIRRKVSMMNGEEVILTSTSISEKHIRNFRKNFMQMKMDNNISFSTDLQLGCYRKLIPTFIWFFKFWCTTPSTQFLTEYHESNQLLPIHENDLTLKDFTNNIDSNNNSNNNNNNNNSNNNNQQQNTYNYFSNDLTLEDGQQNFQTIEPKMFKVIREWFYDNVLGKYFCRITIIVSVSTDGFKGTNPQPSKVFVQFFPHIFYAGFDQFCTFFLIFFFLFIFFISVIFFCFYVYFLLLLFFYVFYNTNYEVVRLFTYRTLP